MSYISTCLNCNRPCGYYIGVDAIKIFCSKDCLIAYEFPIQNHALEKSPDIQTETLKPTDKVEIQKDIILSAIGLESLNCEETSLTKRQFEIIKLVAQGKRTTTIARDLYISCRTVETHIYTLFSIFNVVNRSQLSLIFLCNLKKISQRTTPRKPINQIHERVKELYLKGNKSSRAIALIVGCSQSYVCRIISEVRQEMKNCFSTEAESLKSRSY